jgi:hypothetical protein
LRKRGEGNPVFNVVVLSLSNYCFSRGVKKVKFVSDIGGKEREK